jgi:hypothetical protein
LSAFFELLFVLFQIPFDIVDLALSQEILTRPPQEFLSNSGEQGRYYFRVVRKERQFLSANLALPTSFHLTGCPTEVEKVGR